MAGKSKAAGALEAYRREIISDGIEQRIADLSDAVAAYETNRTDRREQERALAQRQERDEDAVLAAFEGAKAADQPDGEIAGTAQADGQSSAVDVATAVRQSA